MSDGTILVPSMHYVADADGYLLAVSFGADISCHGQSCVGYYGDLPTGFASWETWYASECEQLHKWQVVGLALVKDDSVPDPVESTDLWVGDKARLRTIDDGRGNLQLYNANGQLAVNAYANTGGGGEVDVHDADGVSKAALYATSGKEGALMLKNAAGEATYLYQDDIEKLKNIATSGPGTVFIPDETLTLNDGVLSVNTADAPEEDNTLPITSAAVHTTVGNIEILLGTI